MPVSPSVPGWRITYQIPTTDYGLDGRLTPGMKVGFKTPSGVEAFVFVPQARYTVDSVRAAVQAASDEIEAVHKLKG
jgi:hypothetical protein